MASESVNPRLMKSNIDLLTRITKKPNMISEKLLSRPPFKFLHELTTLIIKTSGYLRGLYADEEFALPHIDTKDAKMAFLDKLIDAIGFINSKAIDVKSSKIVAGLEVEKTNRLLNEFAKAVVDKKPFLEAVEKVRKGQKPSEATIGSTSTMTKTKNKMAPTGGGKDKNVAKRSTTTNANTTSQSIGNKRPPVNAKLTNNTGAGGRAVAPPGGQKAKNESIGAEKKIQTGAKATANSTAKSDTKNHKNDISDQEIVSPVSPESLSEQAESPNDSANREPISENDKIINQNYDSNEIDPESASLLPAKDDIPSTNRAREMTAKLHRITSSVTTADNDDNRRIANDFEHKQNEINIFETPEPSQTFSINSEAIISANNTQNIENNLDELVQGIALSSPPSTANDRDEISENSKIAVQQQQAESKDNNNNNNRNNSGASASVESKKAAKLDANLNRKKSATLRTTSTARSSNKALIESDKISGPGLPTKQQQQPQQQPESAQRLVSARPSSSRPAPPRVMTASRSRLARLSENPQTSPPDQNQNGGRTKTGIPSARRVPPPLFDEQWQPPASLNLDMNEDGGENGGENEYLINSSTLHDTLTKLENENDDAQQNNNDDFDNRIRSAKTSGSKAKGRLVQQLMAAKSELEGGDSAALNRSFFDDDNNNNNNNQDHESSDTRPLRGNIHELCQSIGGLAKALNYLHEDVDPMRNELQRWRAEFRENTRMIAQIRADAEREIEPLRRELDSADREAADFVEKLRAAKAAVHRNALLIGKLIETI